VRIIIEIPQLSEERTTRACIEIMDSVARVGLICEEELGPVPGLYASGVRFAQEPFQDGEHFDLPWVCVQRGWLDCDDAAIWRNMELWREGEHRAGSRVIWPPGTRRYHAQNRRADDTVEDATQIIERATP
jgi:hypothetical protein